MLVSIILLVLCVYILVSDRFASDYTKWAFGMIGVIVGYWLR